MEPKNPPTTPTPEGKRKPKLVIRTRIKQNGRTVQIIEYDLKTRENRFLMHYEN